MFISVIVCTWERGSSLHATLESLCTPANLSARDWEVVVVHGPEEHDEAEAICLDFQARLAAPVVCVHGSKRGHGHALNRGIGEARGDILAMMDDDVRCGERYLDGIRAAFADPDVHAVQGRILLECEGGRPDWMDDEMAALMSLRDYGDQVRELKENLVGSNMLVRRAVIDALGGFATELGPGAAGFLGDSELTMRMRRAGLRIIYAPQIVVWHRLPRTRLTPDAFRDRYVRQGRSMAFLHPLPSSLWRFGLYAVKQMAVARVQAAWLRLRGRSGHALQVECEALHRFAFFWQHCRFALRLARPGVAPVVVPPAARRRSAA